MPETGNRTRDLPPGELQLLRALAELRQGLEEMGADFAEMGRLLQLAMDTLAVIRDDPGTAPTYVAAKALADIEVALEQLVLAR